MVTNCGSYTAMSPEQVTEAFLKAPPLLSQKILDLTVQHPKWMRDVLEVSEWPLGAGTQMEQIIFRGTMPQIERGFSKWRSLNNNTGCGNECTGPNCAYNWSTMGGSAMERKVITLMDRDFRSPSYCVKEIQTTLQFQEVFAQTVINLHKQVDFFKEINVNFNLLTGLAKKYVWDSEGPKPNPADPYSYRNIGTAKLSKLTMRGLEFFYEYMVKMSDCVPFDVVDGAPLFALVSSRQLLSDLYREDPLIRQDIRFSGAANDLLSKYNFMSTIRGMFLPATILWPRRFNIVDGEPVEVLPTVNGIPAEIGTYTDMNPDYELATHEEVLIHGRSPVKLYTMSTVPTLGQNTSFGPEAGSYFNQWLWINPPTETDPARRVGYFMTSATLGISPQHSGGMFGFLVERPSIKTAAAFYPEPDDYTPSTTVITNKVPATSCPCPSILSVTASPVRANTYTAQFAAAVSAVEGEAIQLGLASGGYVTGTVTAVDASGIFVEFSLPAGTPISACTQFTTVYCDSTLGCKSEVLAATACSETGYTLVLKNPIKAATTGQVITGYCGDGSSFDLTLASDADLVQNIWTVTTGGGSCGCGAVVMVCVPPATDPTCAACYKVPSATLVADCS